MSICMGFSQKFKVVLDAGHGGGDSGTNHNSIKEKDVVLSTVLKIGKILDADPAFEVVYTRKTDVFIELRDRADMANREKADLFVSIHCNGVASSAAYGSETFVMGLDRSAMNLEVARKENAVIFKEKNHEEKYKGFDPNKPETLLWLAVGQEDKINKSLVLATRVKEGFTRLKRSDRGIKQSPLWVLDATTMPGVLIELGFVSNKAEGNYLNSDSGQNELAESIANAITKYKDLVTGKGAQAKIEKVADDAKAEEAASAKSDKADKAAASSSDVVYKVQISASSRDLATTPSNFKGLKNISKKKEGKLVRYFYGETSDYDDTKSLIADAKAKGFKSAFVVAFRGAEIITVDEALKGKK